MSNSESNHARDKLANELFHLNKKCNEMNEARLLAKKLSIEHDSPLSKYFDNEALKIWDQMIALKPPTETENSND